MESIYTDFSLIKYIYGDTGIAEKFEVEDALDNDSRLFYRFSKLLQVYKSLPRILFRPSNRVYNNLISFSKDFPSV